MQFPQHRTLYPPRGTGFPLGDVVHRLKGLPAMRNPSLHLVSEVKMPCSRIQVKHSVYTTIAHFGVDNACSLCIRRPFFLHGGFMAVSDTRQATGSLFCYTQIQLLSRSKDISKWRWIRAKVSYVILHNHGVCCALESMDKGL